MLRRSKRFWWALGLGAATSAAIALAGSVAVLNVSLAQEPAPAPQQPSPTQQPAAPQSAQPAQAPAQPPQNRLSQADAELLVTLVRTTLVAVHQANLTGNYTVLRDLSAPGFRDKNSAADLAQIFAPIRQQKIDLGPVVFLDPQLSQAGLNSQGMLHLIGRLATHPVPVSFELLFQSVNGVWQLFGVSISPVQQSVLAPPTSVPAAAPAAVTVNTARPPPRPSAQKQNPPKHTGKPPNSGQAAPAQPGNQSH